MTCFVFVYRLMDIETFVDVLFFVDGSSYCSISNISGSLKLNLRIVLLIINGTLSDPRTKV